MKDEFMEAIEAFEPGNFCADFPITADVVSMLAHPDRKLPLSRKDRQAVERVRGLVKQLYRYWIGKLQLDKDAVEAGLRAGGTAVERGEELASLAMQAYASEADEGEEIDEMVASEQGKWLADFLISDDFLKGVLSRGTPDAPLSPKDLKAVERVAEVVEGQSLYWLRVAEEQGMQPGEYIGGIRAGGTAIERGKAIAQGALQNM
jgi:hypothetical protein